MDEGRLGAVRRSQNHNRKLTYVMNDIIKNQHDLYEHCLTREQHEARSKLTTEVVQMRRAVVRNRVLLQCLHMRRETMSDLGPDPPPLGVYGGRPLDSFSRDIDQRVAWYHPKLRRLRKVEKIKQSCLDHGAILDEDTMKKKINKFFARPLTDPAELQKSRMKQHVGRKFKLNSRGGATLGRYDDDNDLDDLPDPFGAAKITLTLSPFGRLIGLRPNYTQEEISGQAGQSYLVSGVDEDIGRLSQQTDSHVRENNEASASVDNTHTQEPHPLQVKSLQPLPPISSQNSSGSPNMATSSESSLQKDNPNAQTGRDSLPENGDVDGRNAIKARNNMSFNDQSSSSETPVVPASSIKQEPARDDGKVDVSDTGPSKTASDAARQDTPKLVRRKTLILPPIETSKDMVKK